jgi:hypothetical protein
MSTPVITIAAAGQCEVTDSARVHAELAVNGLPASGQAEIAFVAASAAAFVLRGGGATLPLPLPAVGGAAPQGQITHAGTTWQVDWALATDPGPTTDRRLTITILDPAAAVASATFTVEIAAAAPMTLVNVSTSSMNLGQVEADPLITLQVLALKDVQELASETLSAQATRTTRQGTTPAPCVGLTLAWAQEPGPTSIALAPGIQTPAGTACRLDATYTAPATGATSFAFRFTAVAGPFTNFVTVQRNVTTRPRRSIAVLDRSGSMVGARWTNAQLAAHVWLDVMAGIRRGVNPADAVGILVFDDAAYGFRGGSPSNRIKVEFPAGGAIGALPDPSPAALALTPPGMMTPIGDGLIVGLDSLIAGLAAGTQGDYYYSLLLLTDGYENSGTTRVDPDSPPLGAAELFDTKKRQGTRASFSFEDGNAALPRNIRVYPVGIGPGDVQEDVLDDLAYGTVDAAQVNGFYRLTTSITDLTEAFCQIASHDYGGELLRRETTPQAEYGPDPGVTDAVYVTVPSGEHRLVVVMLKGAGGGSIELTTRVSGGAFAALPAAALTTWTRTTHDTAVVDLTKGSLNAAGREFRVRRTAGGTALTRKDVIAVRDLALVDAVTFDRARYRTGQPMRITARLRYKGLPVTGATIRVALEMPGESQGTTLASGASLLPNGGASYVVALNPTVRDRVTVAGAGDHDAAAGASPDPLHPKPAMLQAILAARGLTGLPMETPPSVFVDSTDRLHDDGAHTDGAAGDGDYANTFVRTGKEGTYTFRLTISGILPDGSAFGDSLTVSRWVGIEADRASSVIDIQTIAAATPGQKAVQLTITPKSRTGELLGPFRASLIEVRATGGGITGPIITHPDGRYSVVVEYPEKRSPIVQVAVGGVPMDPVALGGGCLGLLARLIFTIRKLLGL